MNIERLTRLKGIMREVHDQEKHFDIGTWCNPRHPCGTTACALGYAALDPGFQAEGLNWQTEIYLGYDAQGYDAWVDVAGFIIESTEEQPGKDFNPYPVFQGEPRFAAARLFFDISVEQADFLFSGTRYPQWAATALQVIGHIDQVINGVI